MKRYVCVSMSDRCVRSIDDITASQNSLQVPDPDGTSRKSHYIALCNKIYPSYTTLFITYHTEQLVFSFSNNALDLA